jgi:hypothetical protein
MSSDRDLSGALSVRHEHRHLHRFPNYHAPLRFDEHTIDEANYAFPRHRDSGVPCVIRNAISEWPAADRWTRPDYWLDVASEEPVRFVTGIRQIFTDPESRVLSAKQAISELIGSVANDATPRAQQVLFVLNDTGPRPFDINDDVHPFRFAPSWVNSSSANYRRPLRYPPLRAFIHRDSYTDWHDHMVDDTLTVQVAGRKLFMLLPPTPQTWMLHRTVFASERHLDPTFTFDDPTAIRPYSVELGPGDVIFIPPYWQHAVESVVDGEFGVTLACAAGTPAHRREPLRNGYVRRTLVSHLTNIARGDAGTWSRTTSGFSKPARAKMLSRRVVSIAQSTAASLAHTATSGNGPDPWRTHRE